jgi:CheY-like chemotaxis protein
MTDNSTVLVAEDNDFVRLQIVKFLKDEGYNVLEAIDGNEAINIVQNESVDITIVDVRMEPVDGFDFIRAVRGMNLPIPVILVTGDNSPDVLEKSGEWGVSAVLIKPVQKDRLLKAVERSLAMARRKAGS